jgi:tetratricopeptide (TPR) repeat protein
VTGAIADFEGAIRQYKDFSEAYILLARTLLDAKEFVRAINVISELIDRKLDFRAAGFLIRAYAWRGLGKMDAAREDFVACIAENTTIITHYPDRYFYPYKMRGDAYSALQQEADAVADYRKALDIDPNDQDAGSLRSYIEKYG